MVILASSKDFCSTVGCAYLIYKLLCLKDPAHYFGKVSGDAIDIINIAINAEQAKNVFFKGFCNRLKKAPWFQGKYIEKTNVIEFKKSITLYSGHSERESHEGLNLILAILDEISGFAQTSQSGNMNAKTGEAIYNAFRGAVDSRFPDYGKVVLLSFPRYEGDFISTHYDRMIKTKETVTRRHTYVIDDEKPETADNVFEIEWDEDFITEYVIPNKILAVKAPSWEVNPSRSIEDYKESFLLNPNDAYQRFACKPHAIEDGLFRDSDALKERMLFRNPVDERHRIDVSWRPKDDTIYYIHADLAQKMDRAAVAVAHVEKWVDLGKIMDQEQIAPIVVVDFVTWWEPQRNMPIDLSDVAEWIINLKRRGIRIGRATTDRWNCLPAGSPVYTPNGIKYIEDIREGDLVSTRFGPSMVGSTRNSGVQEVFRVKSKFGYEITGTASHKVLTTCGWKTIGQLTVEDRIVVSNNVGATTDGDLTTDQAYVLGALIADGWCGHKNDDWVGLTTADDVFIDAVRVAAKRGFGFDKQIIGKDQIVDGVLSKAKNYTFVGRKFVRQLRALGLDRSTAKNKHVPHSVMTASPEAKASFLAGYIDGDGGVQSYTDRNGHYRQRLTMDTVSDRLSEELRYLLLSLGLEPCLMSTDKVTNKGPVSYTRITLEGNKGAKALSIIKPFLLRKASVDSVGKTMYTFVDNELSLPIKSIESAGMVQTYDISVPETEEFICGGVVTHNSVDFQKQLNSIGIKSETLSVARREYDDLVLTVYDKRVILPYIELLLKELLQLKIINDKKVDHPSSGCFVGETRISLLDGTRPMISELDGKEVWVYSATPDGKIVPGRARGRMTKMTTDLVDVILDSGAVVRCTPEHRWMLRSGEYVEAQNIRPGVDRLMPINQVWPVNGGYERVTDRDGVRTLTHHMVVRGMGLDIDDGYVVHHKNHVKTDNRPENLEVVSLPEHSAHHTKGRHDDEDYREALYAGLKEFNSLSSTKKKRSKYMKGLPTDWYLEKARKSKTFRSDITIDSLLSVKDDPEATNANSAARILGCGRNVVVRVLREHGFESWDDFVFERGENHKVRAVVPVKLDDSVPVYDLEVDRYHNFALSAGVFVHNSKDLADAVAGAVHNAIAYSPRGQDAEIEVFDYTSVKARHHVEDVVELRPDIPKDIADWLAGMSMI